MILLNIEVVFPYNIITKKYFGVHIEQVKNSQYGNYKTAINLYSYYCILSIEINIKDHLAFCLHLSYKSENSFHHWKTANMFRTTTSSVVSKYEYFQSKYLSL